MTLATHHKSYARPNFDEPCIVCRHIFAPSSQGSTPAHATWWAKMKSLHLGTRAKLPVGQHIDMHMHSDTTSHSPDTAAAR